MYLTNYLGIAINEMFGEIIININNKPNVILIILILMLMFQIGALVNLIIQTIIIFMILIKPIVNYIDHILYKLSKYELNTSISDNQILQIGNNNYIYIDQLKKYLKVDKNVNIKSLNYNNFDNTMYCYYNIEYNGLYIINKITNNTSKYKQILNKIFPQEITDEILRFLCNLLSKPLKYKHFLSFNVTN
jgi:hypothetical protein